MNSRIWDLNLNILESLELKQLKHLATISLKVQTVLMKLLAKDLQDLAK
jgi:hypothetical protein